MLIIGLSLGEHSPDEDALEEFFIAKRTVNGQDGEKNGKNGRTEDHRERLAPEVGHLWLKM